MRRSCKSCSNEFPRAEFSKNQWQKGSNAKCKGCVSGNPPPPPEPVLVQDSPVVVEEVQEKGSVIGAGLAIAGAGLVVHAVKNAAEEGRLEIAIFIFNRDSVT